MNSISVSVPDWMVIAFCSAWVLVEFLRWLTRRLDKKLAEIQKEKEHVILQQKLTAERMLVESAKK